jgi:hypothetical protein
MRKLAARRRRAEVAQATADALRQCTGAVQVTVHDGPVTATSVAPDGAHLHARCIQWRLNDPAEERYRPTRVHVLREGTGSDEITLCGQRVPEFAYDVTREEWCAMIDDGPGSCRTCYRRLTAATPHPHDNDQDSGVEDPHPLAEDYPGQHVPDFDTRDREGCACQECEDAYHAREERLRDYR